MTSPWWTPDTRIPAGRVVSSARSRIGALLATMLLLAGFGVAAFAVPQNSPKVYDSGLTEYPPTLSGLVARCTSVVEWPSPPADTIGWLPPGSYFHYVMRPPVAGPYLPEAPEAGVYPITAPVSLPKAVNFMWHGGLVIWYQRSLDRERVDVLHRIVTEHRGDRPYLVSPWPVENSVEWPGERAVLVAGWGHAQSCDVGSVLVTDEFEQYLAARPAPGQGAPMSDPGRQARPVGSPESATFG